MNTITRSPDHRYALVDDTGSLVAGWYPGATTILDSIAKPALMRWVRNETAAAAVKQLPQLSTLVTTSGEEAARKWLSGETERIAADARSRGSGAHRAIEAIAAGESIDASDEARPFVDAWLAWRDAFRPRLELNEAPVLSITGEYGGTLDALALDSAGVRWALDWKSTRGSGGVYESYVLQLAAYAGAELIADTIGGEARSMPTVEHAAVVLLRPDASWQFVPVRVGRPEREAFAATVRLRRYLDRDVKAAIGKAVR